MRIILFAGCLVMISLNALSQSDNRPAVSKGYYSIGNKNRVLVDMDRANLIRERYVPDPYSQSPKGYYSTEAKRRAIPWRKVRGESRGYLVPVVTKGYYSIGRNAEQLRK
ncbi:MAG: hypothetical protein JNK79_14795 [Chitinophagaceae bacterium]|nr:hypothetical protein [Chitinophagaceae bacterium]